MAKEISKIWQINNDTFGIIWNDGKVMEYCLSDLQEMCPCARCQLKKDKSKDTTPATAESIESVGRYALKIRFKEGCSLGIYDFESLYEMGGQ